MLEILLVDDMPSAELDVRNGLKSIGVACNIDSRVPKERDRPFGCELPSGEGLDRFDVALIDLELFPAQEAIDFRDEDLRGGSEVLPYLRREAPWLPVIAVSRLFRRDVEHFLPIAGSFGFDGQLPREAFLSHAFSRRLWEAVLVRARGLRRQALMGEQALLGGPMPKVELAKGTGAVNREIPTWEELAGSTFRFAEKVVLSPLGGGFSGALVFRAHVVSGGMDGGGNASWILKMSKEITKLQLEARSHLRMMRSGFDHAKAVPLLWQGVVVEGRAAAIAYQFAAGAVMATEALEKGLSPEAFAKRLGALLVPLYKGRRSEPLVVGSAIREWLPNPERVGRVTTQMAAGWSKDFMERAGRGEEEDALGEVVEAQRCLVHGDLHCGNIMLVDGRPDVLIDFARSRVGPIAADAAKIVSDLLIRVVELRDSRIVGWSEGQGELGKVIKELDSTFQMTPGDAKLFARFLVVFLASALDYDEIRSDTKAWIREVLARVVA